MKPGTYLFSATASSTDCAGGSTQELTVFRGLTLGPELAPNGWTIAGLGGHHHYEPHGPRSGYSNNVQGINYYTF